MGISELCIRRPVMTTLLMASLALAGFFGYRQLPIAAIPRIDVPTITVTAELPGASPDTMAVSVAAPLERRVFPTPGLTPATPLRPAGRVELTDKSGARIIDVVAEIGYIPPGVRVRVVSVSDFRIGVELAPDDSGVASA